MFFFISLICRSYLCIWDTNHLSVLHKANKHFEASHFISFMVSVHIQKLSGLRGSFMNLSLYGLYFQALRMMNFSLLFSHNNYCHYSSFGAQIVKLSNCQVRSSSRWASSHILYYFIYIWALSDPRCLSLTVYFPVSGPEPGISLRSPGSFYDDLETKI